MHTLDAAADRAGVEPGYLHRLVDLGIIEPAQPGRFTPGDVRRARMALSLEGAGISLEAVADAMRRGALSLGFLDAPSYERFAALADETFQQVSERTGIPLELLSTMRESTGSPEPAPDERLHETEMALVPFLQIQLEEGFRTVAVERLLRVYGESTRRIAETEGSWWTSEVIEPAIAAGKGPEDIARPELADRTAPLAEQAVLAMYHLQQSRVWAANIIEGFETLMAEAGIHSRIERPPVICFIDLTGYTRLTQEGGDDLAVDLATTLVRLVQRCSARHGGKLVKWLGDGAMLHFPEAGPGVEAALEMLDELAAAGLPSAHVGLHAGPVIFQQGDYFGKTVNTTSRIADYARPGEVLVSQAVADAASGMDGRFVDIGPVELKGMPEPIHLLRAMPPSVAR